MQRAIAAVVGPDAAPTVRRIEQLIRAGDCPPTVAGSHSWVGYETNGRYMSTAAVVDWWIAGSARRREEANAARSEAQRQRHAVNSGTMLLPGTLTSR
jgi:hypothetical protein